MEVFDTKSFNYSIKDATICVDHESAKKIKLDNVVPSTHVSLNFLHLILEVEDIFNYAILVFSGNLKNFQICENQGSEYELRSFISKKDMYRAFVEAIRNDLLEFTDKTRKRFHILKEMRYMSYYEQCHKNDVYELVIEGEKYKFNVDDFFTLLKMDPLEFSNYLKNEKTIHGVKSEYYLYALKHYFTSNYLVSNYEMSHNMSKNYTMVSSDVYVDTYAVNMNYKDDELVNQVKLNSEFESYILDGMKDDFSDLEKCIYIYMKLCKVLTYDEEFYAAHQKGKVLEKHKQLKHLSEITLTNNSVVCFEFSKIYSYFLKSFGLLSKSYDSKEYGEGHDNVEFRCGKYIILADPITSIFTGDLFNVKLDKKPLGLLCLNRNADTQLEFDAALERVFDYIKCEETFEYQEALKTYSLDDLLQNYREYTDNHKEIPLEMRVSILMEKVVSLKNISGMDVYSYIKLLGNNCFSKDELRNNVVFEIVKNNNTGKEGVEVLPIGILVVNSQGFAANDYENDYYIFSPDEGIKQISYYTLKEYFDNKIYEYIDPERDTRIPGIKRSATL